MKKEYSAPKMEIVDYKLQACLLSGSGEVEECDSEYCDEVGFDFRHVDHNA